VNLLSVFGSSNSGRRIDFCLPDVTFFLCVFVESPGGGANIVTETG